MSKELRKVEHNEDLHDVLIKMFDIISENIEAGNLGCFTTGYNGKKIHQLHVVEGRQIDYNLSGETPLYAENPETDENFLNAFSDLKSTSIEDRKHWSIPEYVVIRDGENYGLYSYIDTNYGTALRRVMEMGKYDSFHRFVQDSRVMEPGEYEFLTATKMRMGTSWSYEPHYEIEMTPEDLVKSFAGTGYDGDSCEPRIYRCVDKISGNPGSLRGDSYYRSFKTVEEIAEQHGLDYKNALLSNISQENITLIEKILGQSVDIASVKDIKRILDSISREKYSGTSLKELEEKLMLLEEEAKKIDEVEDTIEKLEDTQTQKE